MSKKTKQAKQKKIRAQDAFIWQFPTVIAHRGGGHIAPENTLAGMRCALDHGFTMVEFDVKLTQDNVCIVMHDDNLKRTSNGEGLVAQKSFNDLSKLDFGSWHSAYYAGEPVPTLASVLRFCQENNVFCNIEIKPCAGREIETGQQVAQVISEIWKADHEFLLYSSFYPDALRAAAEITPNIPRALLVEGEVPDNAEEYLESLGCVAIHLDEQYVTQDIIHRFHQESYRVATWTVNDYRRAKELLKWGVDSLFTDELSRVPSSLESR